MNLYDEKDPFMDLDVTVTVKVGELVKLHQLLHRIYGEEEGLRETAGPLLEKLHDRITDAAENLPRHRQAWTPASEWFREASERSEKHLRRIRKALMRGERLRITCLAPVTAEQTRLTAEPETLWESDGGWYLTGYSHHDGENHTWPVALLLKVKRKPAGKGRYGKAGMTAEVSDGAERDAAWPEAAAGEGEAPHETEIQSETAGPGEGEAPVPEPHPGGHHPHYSLPGKHPHRPGLPSRLERLLIRSEKLNRS